MGRYVDLAGMKFNRLTVLQRVANKGYKVQWLCACECGNLITCRTQSLKSGHTKSCGCLARETIIQMHVVHNESKTRLYNIWHSMIARCNDKNNSRYGGRGIAVCGEWATDFLSFRNWALKNGYEDGLTIDRIDIEQNYCPENCRWATMKVQQNNRCNTIQIEYDGEIKQLAIWADEVGMQYRTLYNRIFVRKWSIEDALTKPVRKPKTKMQQEDNDAA